MDFTAATHGGKGSQSKRGNANAILVRLSELALSFPYPTISCHRHIGL